MSATTCPGCGAAAEITERFSLASTDGPVAHVALSCPGGHHYRMAADKLPALRAVTPTRAPANSRPPLPSQQHQPPGTAEPQQCDIVAVSVRQLLHTRV